MSTVAVATGEPPSSAAHARDNVHEHIWPRHLALVGLAALIAVAPFEATRPLIRLPGQSLSGVEAVLLAAIAVGGVSAVVHGSRLRELALRLSLRPPAGALIGAASSLTAPWIAVIVAALVATVFTSVDRVNALHMTARYALAFAVFLLTLTTVTSVDRLQTALTVLVGSGIVVATIAILEYAEVPAVLAWLKAFRPSVSLIGAQVRAAGPLQYPTIASMYLEICFASGLGLLVQASQTAPRVVLVPLVIMLAVIGEGIVVTFTRSGLITAGVSLLLVAGTALRRQAPRRTMLALSFVLVALVAEVSLSRSTEAMFVRMSSEGQEGWYSAGFDVPGELTLATGATVALPVRLTNTGRVTWDPDAPQPFRLSYHWVEIDSNRVVDWEGRRTLLPAPLTPGSSLSVTARVDAPYQPGGYRLLWDIEHTHRLWFSTEPDANLTMTHVRVDGAAISGHPPGRRLILPERAVRPRRGLLWTAALWMLKAHPITGVGPDNFRLSYGRYVDVKKADPRVHSNNMYLEMLAGTGLIGAIALGWFGWRAARMVLLALSLADPIAIGLAAAVIAVAVHGLADSFLGFTPTYVAIAFTLGALTVAARSGEAHAHRV